MNARLIACLFALTALAPAAHAQSAAEAPAEPPKVAADAPYVVSDANAGTTPIKGDAVYKAFHEEAGIDRMIAILVKLYHDDPRLKDIFASADDDKLHRLLTEQVCYIAGGPCHYSGRDMETAHRYMGVQQADFNALVEDLQTAMDQEHVPVWAQNRLLAKLAPMQRVIVARKGYPG
jgi:hemoglobin